MLMQDKESMLAQVYRCLELCISSCLTCEVSLEVHGGGAVGVSTDEMVV